MRSMALDAAHPGRAADVVGHVLDGQVEVVRELEDPPQQPVARQQRPGSARSSSTRRFRLAKSARARCQPASASSARATAAWSLRLELLEPRDLCRGGGLARVERGDALLRALPPEAAREWRARARGRAWSPGATVDAIVHAYR